MPVTPQGRTQPGSRPRKAKKRRLSPKGRRLLIARVVLLLLIMLCITAFTFVFSALVTGRGGVLSRIAGDLLSPGAPKLTIQDAKHEYKVSPLSQTLTQEFKSFLNSYTAYEENLGIFVLNTENPSAADLQNQTPFQRELAKNGYSPQALTVTELADRKISFPTAPTVVDTYLFFPDAFYYSSSLEEVNTLIPDTDGICYVLISAIWEAERSRQKARSGLYCFAITFDRPAVFSMNTEDIDPGELLVFYAEYLMPGEPVTVQSSLPLNLQFSPYGKRQMIALAPISYDIRPGTYSTTLSAGGVSKTFDITVKDKEFAVQYVTIDPQIVAETRNEETNMEFQDRINPILAEHLPELLWRGRATLPVPEGKVLTLFGSRRYINDDVNSYRHSGLDLQAPVGTEVHAINDGRVLFADYLAYTGHTILIEHGLGLKSWYYHMDELLVAPGDNVHKDDVIGLSGDTGFAAEPHLHLTLSVGETYINPVTALNQQLFLEPM
ncbi:MAG: M23 family metallopeptidase [Clostridiales bacterium]|nr:M23 family metallopeptidase [Clostridiales bacterium]